jgi:hypothetical protein
MQSNVVTVFTAWYRLPKADVPFPLRYQIPPGISYQLHTAHDCNSQLTSSLQTLSRLLVIRVGHLYIASVWTAQKTSLSRACLLLRVGQLWISRVSQSAIEYKKLFLLVSKFCTSADIPQYTYVVTFIAVQYTTVKLPSLKYLMVCEWY